MSRRLKLILRTIVIVAGMGLFFCLYSYYTNLHFFGSYDLTAVVICTAVIFVIMQAFGTAPLEGGDHAKKDQKFP